MIPKTNIKYWKLVTPTQNVVIKKMINGQKQVDIAKELRLSKVALYRHVQRARVRMNCSTVHQMIAIAVRDQIIYDIYKMKQLSERMRKLYE